MSSEAVDGGSREALPRRFGSYLLFDQIGEGGMARIFLARARTDLGAQRHVVVKQILPALSSSDEFGQLLIDEAKLAAMLSHGNIVQVIDLGRDEGRLFIAMEYVEGFDLRELLRQCTRRKVPLPVEFLLLLSTEILTGLDYAHRKKDDAGVPLGIVHRDVSPSNVLVSFDGEVKLCDFGIARAIGAGHGIPEGAIQGKAGYMSPEGARGEVVDARSDVFSVGIILWELVAGRRLYRGEGGQPPSLEVARAADVPALPTRGYPDEGELNRIVGKALEKDVGARYPTARAMLQDLEAYVGAAGLHASPLRLGEWMMDHFGQQIVEVRRARERAAKALDASQRAGESPPRVAQPPPPPSRKVASVRPARIEPPPPSLEAMVRPSTRDARHPVGLVVLVLVILGLVATIVAINAR